MDNSDFSSAVADLGIFLTFEYSWLAPPPLFVDAALFDTIPYEVPRAVFVVFLVQQVAASAILRRLPMRAWYELEARLAIFVVLDPLTGVAIVAVRDLGVVYVSVDFHVLLRSRRSYSRSTQAIASRALVKPW